MLEYCMLKKGEKGISTVVAAVLLILIVIALIAIIWAAIIPMVKTSLAGNELCLNADLTISSSYTCSDLDEGITAVMVKRGAKELALNRMQLIFACEGESYDVIVDAPGKNEGETLCYDVAFLPEKISVAPIVRVGQTQKFCDITSDFSPKKCSLAEDFCDVIYDVDGGDYSTAVCDIAEDCEEGEICVDGDCVADTNCYFLSAYWNQTEATELDVVELVVEGNSYCNGKTASFEVYENDEDSSGLTQPSDVIFSDGEARAFWVAEWLDDGVFGGNPDFFFNVSYGDESLESNELDVLMKECVDNDGDGYGAEGTYLAHCDSSTTEWDCDDSEGACNIDGTSLLYLDFDGDGFGNFSVSHRACDAPSNYVDDDNDCDDGDYEINPDAQEIHCNDVDENCDTINSFEGCECQPGETQECGTDDGECVSGIISCELIGGFWEFGDCEGETGPSQEVCDGKDNNCNNVADDGAVGCSGNTPYCFNGECVQCLIDLECDDGEECTVNDIRICSGGVLGSCEGVPVEDGTTCEFWRKCYQGNCVDCLVGDWTCSEGDYLTCINNQWKNQGRVVGMCGIECTSDGDCLYDEYCDETMGTCEEGRCPTDCSGCSVNYETTITSFYEEGAGGAGMDVTETFTVGGGEYCSWIGGGILFELNPVSCSNGYWTAVGTQELEGLIWRRLARGNGDCPDGAYDCSGEEGITLS